MVIVPYSLTKIVGIALYIPSFLYLAGPALEQNPEIKKIFKVTRGTFNEIIKRLTEQSSSSALSYLFKAFALLLLLFAAIAMAAQNLSITSWFFPYLPIAISITSVCALSLFWILFHGKVAPRFLGAILGTIIVMAVPGPHQSFLHYQLNYFCQADMSLPLFCDTEDYPPFLAFASGAIISAVILYLAMTVFSGVVVLIIFVIVEFLLAMVDLLHETFPKDSFGGTMVLLQLISGLLLAM